jgi:hypothetical protein
MLVAARAQVIQDRLAFLQLGLEQFEDEGEVRENQSSGEEFED